MSRQTLVKLEEYKKRHVLSDLALAKRLDVYPVYFYRWRKAGKVIGAYERIIEDFLSKEAKNQG